MEHQEKQEIFDQYAKSQGYQDFIEIINDYSPWGILQQIFTACDLVQEEQQKRIAENVKIEPPFEHFSQWIDKASIINPENLIK